MTLGPKRSIGGKIRLSFADREQEQLEPLDSDDVVEVAKELLTKQGLRLPRRPKDSDGSYLDPVFPEDVSLIPSDELGRLHGQFTAMADYAFGQLAKIDTAHEVASYNDKLERTTNFLRGKGSVKDREAQGLTHNKSVQQSQAYYVKFAHYRLLRTVAEGFDRKAKALSREMSRRQGDYERTKE